MFVLKKKRCFISRFLFRMSRLCVCLLASPWVDPFNPLSFTCSDLWYCTGCALLPWKRRCRKKRYNTFWLAVKTPQISNNSWWNSRGVLKISSEKLVSCVLQWNLQQKMYPRKLTSGFQGGLSSVGNLWSRCQLCSHALGSTGERAWRQDVKPLFHGLSGSDEALFSDLQGDDCRWQARKEVLVCKSVLLQRIIGCC